VPIGQQAEMFPRGAEEFGVLENDILLCKMRPGHEIHLFMHAIKSIGKDHAKFSPVGTYEFCEQNIFITIRILIQISI
jgi:DNA-directed RNA polymerase alpha subunit